MPFDDAGVPGQGEAGDDGVAVDAGGEGVEAGQVVLPDGVEPVVQALALALGEHGREGADVPGEGVESCRRSRVTAGWADGATT